MRAYGLTTPGGPENEAFLEVPEPVAGPGELVVRIRAAGVNPGDVRLRDGEYGGTAAPPCSTRLPGWSPMGCSTRMSPRSGHSTRRARRSPPWRTDMRREVRADAGVPGLKTS